MHVVGNPAAQCTGPAPVAIPPYAGAWLTAVPTEHTTMMDPHAMQLALRRRLTCALLCHCGPTPGCGQVVDAYGDHALACPRTGILAGCAKGRNGEDARCARGGRRRRPNRPAAMTPVDGAVLRVAERRKRASYPELVAGGRQRLVVLGSEVGGRWNTDALRFVQALVRLLSYRTPAWWCQLSMVVQQAVASTALGQPCQGGPNLDRILDLAEPAGHMRLPADGSHARSSSWRWRGRGDAGPTDGHEIDRKRAACGQALSQRAGMAVAAPTVAPLRSSTLMLQMLAYSA
ncbi:unnamed protein product, partial [Symbiodinium microadriaticum]